MQYLLSFLLLLIAYPVQAGVFSPGGTSSGSGSTISNGTAFPGSPSTGDFFYVTDDSAVGACDSAAGSAATLCYWNGSSWEAVNIAASSDTLDTVFDNGKAIDNASSFANAVRILDANGDGWAFYTDATTGPVIVCVDNNVENACTSYTRTLASGQTLVYKNSGGTDIFTLTESTGALTNVTLDASASGNTITLSEETWWDVAACQNTTAQMIWDTPTSNAASAACDTGTNTQKAYATFDADTDQGFQTNWVLPADFTGAIDVKFVWKAAATSGTVGWCAQLIRVADGSTSDPAYPAQASGNCVSDTAKGTTLQENHASITGVTCTSCVAGDHVYVRISRDANGSAVTDSMTGNALLMKFGRVWRRAQ